MSTARQASFSGGEVSPFLYGRFDHPRYGSSLRKMLNFVALSQGAAQNRPGTKWIASTKDPTQKAIYVPFVFSSTQAYALEIGFAGGAGYIRFDQGGAPVVALGIPYEIASPFTLAMLPYLKWAQAGDILTIDYGGQDAGAAALAPQFLRRLAHTNWTIGAASFAPSYPNVPDVAVLAFGAWSNAVIYSLGDRVTQANQEWVSVQNNNLNNLPAAGSLFWTLANDNAHASVAMSWVQTAVLQLADGTAVESSPSPALNYTGTIGADRPIKLTLGAMTGPVGSTYLHGRMYRGKNGVYGWTADFPAPGVTFTDDGVAPDYTQQPPKSTDPFALPGGGHDYPSSVGYFEQRRIFARQNLHPSRIQGSKTGQISNFDVSLFGQADDAVSFDLASAELDEIRSLVPLTTIFVLTQSGVWSVRGYQGSALTPTSVNARKQQHAVGASWVSPARVGDAILYEQDGGGAVHDFVFDAFYDVGRSTDISSHAQHFLEGHTVVRIVYAARPRKTVWIVRDDGVLLGVTYLRSSDPNVPSVVAWHQHTTDGTVEDACVLPEGTEDAVYLIVKRTVNGAPVRYKERMQTRLVNDVRLGVFLDAALSFDGRNAGAVTMKATGATYNGGDEVTVLASAAKFVPDDVGSAIVLNPDSIPAVLDFAGVVVTPAVPPFRMTILAYTDATHVTARLDAPLAAAFQNVATTSWGFARRFFSGLGHLEGKTVAVLADGSPAAAAKQDSSLVVTAGQVAIDEPAVIAHAGLPYVSDLELLDLATGPGRLNVKSISRAALEVVAARGMWVGETFDKLKEAKLKELKDAFGNPSLKTGIVDVFINGSWNTGGRACFRQVDPLPLTVVAALREYVAGGS